jgi:hypothetical protein
MTINAAISLTKGRVLEAHLNTERVRCPRADFLFSLPIRTRAALGLRSTGTKTGPHGACLTAAIFGEAGKTPVSQRRGKPGSGAEPSGGTGGECRKRERRKAGALQTRSAQPRFARTLVGQCAFRRSAYPLFAGGESKRVASYAKQIRPLRFVA